MKRVLVLSFLVSIVSSGTSSAVTFNLNLQVRERAVWAEHFDYSPDGDCTVLTMWTVGAFTEAAQVFGHHYPVLPLVDVTMEKVRICTVELDGEPLEEWTTLLSIGVIAEVPIEAIQIDPDLGEALVQATIPAEEAVSGALLMLNVQISAHAISGVYPSETLHLLTFRDNRKENFRRTGMSRDASAEVSVTDQNGTEYFTSPPETAVIERIHTGRLQLFRQ